VRLTSASLPESANLINHQLDRPLPFADASFDGIYAFHVVEHLSPRVSESFLRDLYRLLKPGGVCRASTPDLEFHATEYLRCLHDEVASPSFEHYARYRWAVCNLIDQCARQISGGEMLEVIRRGEFTADYVKYMNGDLLRFLFPPAPPPGGHPDSNAPKRNVLRRIAGAVRRRLRSRVSPKSHLELTHERNLWLFDRVSCSRLFAQAEFRNVVTTDHRTSHIPNWDRYNFDESVFGSYPLEPSLYMEGTK